MPDLTAQEMATKLLADRFTRATPDVQSVTDPIADTPMIVSLDELRPYDLNPRVTRNPRYDDIKASIRQRGLDAPPAITRRPGEPHYMVRNGGNTRLAILRELWADTKEERFFRIACLYRPWSPRGEIVALTGHLCENELHGGLTFIERALGVEKAHELYAQETGKPLTQTELARRLAADGYPVTQSHISRMQDAVRFLLPAIPSVLYGGLGRPQIERLGVLRKAASRTWERHAQSRSLPTDFAALFQDVLTQFDGEPAAFTVRRVQDELIGQMAELLTADYDALSLEIVDAEARQHALTREPVSHSVVEPSRNTAALGPTRPARTAPPTSSAKLPAQHRAEAATEARSMTGSASAAEPPQPSAPPNDNSKAPDSPLDDRLQAHIVSPAGTTDRLQSIRRTIADATGDPLQDFQANVVHAIPVQAGGLHPISDVWYIEPALDAIDRLRAHIAQLACEIAEEAGLAHRIEAVDDGIGIACTSGKPPPKESPPPVFARAVLSLLGALSAGYLHARRSTVDGVRLADDLAPLLQGFMPSQRIPESAARLSDVGVVKLFRLIRLARRVLELESATLSRAAHTPGP